MTASEPKAAPPPSQPGRSQITSNPYVGILGVFLGAGIATLNGRLLSVGLPDLRGAAGLGFDEASWIPTARARSVTSCSCRSGTAAAG